MKRPRILVIGLDGATLDLVGPWARAGLLPTLARLIDHGVHGPLHAWPNMNSAAAWTSLVTGYNPGQHGIYDFGEAAPQRGHRWHPVTAADRRKDPFWRLLSAAGQHVGVLNVPVSYPADSVQGFMLSGMDAPGDRSPGFAHPPALLDELRQHGIEYLLDVPNLGIASQRDPHRLPAAVQEMVDARARTLLHLMDSHPWQALMAVFVATDRVQHFYWPPAGRPLDHPHWAPIRQLYQQVDAHLGHILDRLDDQTTVLLVSDHGFGPVRAAVRGLNTLFSRLGLLRYAPGGGRLQGRLLRTLLLLGRRIVPQQLQLSLAQAFPALRLRALGEKNLAGIHWPATRVFAQRVQVYLNLQGRQPEGIVSPRDYDALRQQVRDILLRLADPVTGRPLVRAVHRREDLYHGPYLERAADLLVEWQDKGVGDAFCYPGEGDPIVVQPLPASGAARRWGGTHRSPGILVAWGPSIKRGATVSDATLYDVAPTILHLQGHPIPRDMDGHVLTGILDEDYLRRHPVQYCDPASAIAPPPGAGLDEAGARQVAERLRGLGYLE
jgi:predicted AlkP superfamily phosphohydrolase/phosphomutase